VVNIGWNMLKPTFKHVLPFPLSIYFHLACFSQNLACVLCILCIYIYIYIHIYDFVYIYVYVYYIYNVSDSYCECANILSLIIIVFAVNLRS